MNAKWLSLTMSRWDARRWWVAAGVAVVVVLIIGIPTDLIDTPAFSRDIAPTWWSWPTLLATAVLSGLLAATYINQEAPTVTTRTDRSGRRGIAGTALSFFAVGCPVCNKIVLLALGTTGATSYFQPAQPILAIAGIAVLGWALIMRVRRENACPVSR